MHFFKFTKLFFVVLTLVIFTGCDLIQNVTTHENQGVLFTEERIKDLYPSWVLIEKEVINLNGHELIILGLVRKQNEYIANVRFTICKYVENQWVEVWRVPKDLETEYFTNIPITKRKLYIKDFLSVNYGDSALLVANVLVGGNHGVTQVIAFTADNKDHYALKMFDSHGFMKTNKEDEYIFIEGNSDYGTHKIYLENGDFREEIFPRSHMANNNAIEMKFILNPSNNFVYPSESCGLIAKVGHTIVFVPANEVTRQAFDNGELEIYTDAWNEPPVTICYANKISSGNTYTFEKAGIVHFVLISQKNELYMNNENIEPTFIVTVEP